MRCCGCPCSQLSAILEAESLRLKVLSSPRNASPFCPWRWRMTALTVVCMMLMYAAMISAYGDSSPRGSLETMLGSPALESKWSWPTASHDAKQRYDVSRSTRALNRKFKSRVCTNNWGGPKKKGSVRDHEPDSLNGRIDEGITPASAFQYTSAKSLKKHDQTFRTSIGQCQKHRSALGFDITLYAGLTEMYKLHTVSNLRLSADSHEVASLRSNWQRQLGMATYSDRRDLVASVCTNKDISIFQSPDGTSGIPRYAVQIMNNCISDCPPSDIHVFCGWFASALLVNPNSFKRIAYDDCIVNGGKPLRRGETLRFTYANSFMYPLRFKSASFCK